MKAILLSRVSTHSQVLTKQTNKLFNAAHRDGFTNDNIILIENKVCAKFSEANEEFVINEMKELINKDSSISCIYVDDISRIARNERVLCSFRDFLVEKHIQLIVLNPSLKLLDDENRITQGAQIMFTIFCAYVSAEREMRNIKNKLQ